MTNPSSLLKEEEPGDREAQKAETERERKRPRPARDDDQWIDVGPVREEASAAVARGADKRPASPVRRDRRKKLPDDVPHDVKQARLARLQAQLNEQARAISETMVGTTQRVLVTRPSKKDAREQTRPFFEHFGLAKFEDVRPDALSGGMRQRVSFLRTLMAEKDILLLDEPFGALDSITRGQMQEWLLRALGDVPRTVLLVTHDVDEALLLSRTVVVMSARPGRVVTVIDVGMHTEGMSRREIVTSPEFIELKETALEAIE